MQKKRSRKQGLGIHKQLGINEYMYIRLEAGESPASGKTHTIMRGAPGSGPQLN